MIVNMIVKIFVLLLEDKNNVKAILLMWSTNIHFITCI